MRRTTARISVKEVQNCTLVRIDGEINESFDPSALAALRGVVVFDLAEVGRITSHGVLLWITALKGLHASYYCFINCRPSTMDQFNLVQAFGQRGELISFYARFVCTECAHEVEQLVDLRQQVEIHEKLSLPSVPCDACGMPAEFDEVPELYFKYVLAAPPPRPPQAASAAIGGGQDVVATRGRRFSMKKEVSQSLTAFWLSGSLDDRNYFKRAADGVDGIAVIELAELEGISERAIGGFKKFLDQLDDRVMFARVPVAIVGVLGELLQGRRAAKAVVLSFLVPLRCTGCHAVFGGDIAAERLSDLLIGQRSEVCPHCMHPLEPQCDRQIGAAAVALPLGAPPPEVDSYLRARPPTGRVVGVDRLATAVDPQQLLLGKYHILQALGKGGMGEVFLARHVGTGQFEKLVVLKRIRRDRLLDLESRELFLKEARIAARLSHRNIVQIFDLEKVDDEFLISMEYVNGIDLAGALQLSRMLRISWPIEICCAVVAELCSALQAAHTYLDEDGTAAPIIHRDVSPSNILLSTEGAVKLTDFGIARVAGDPNDADRIRGKAGYAAPEQWTTSGGVTDERSDIYAAGVVLFECVTLRPISFGPTRPPTGPRPPGWSPHSPPQICVIRSGTPPLLQDVFERAIQPEPELRYKNARDLGRDLERIGRLVGETTTEDLALWVRRLVALKLETSGHEAPPIVTMNTGGLSASGRHPTVNPIDQGRKS
jgi:serine/threonine protein kinase